MDLLQKARELGFEIQIQPGSTLWIKYPTGKNTCRIFHFKSLLEFEAFLDGFLLGQRANIQVTIKARV